MLGFQLSPFLISLILTVGYDIIIIQGVNFLNILPQGWKVSLSEIIVCSGTRVQWESLISWLLFCLIVLLHKALLSDCSMHHVVPFLDFASLDTSKMIYFRGVYVCGHSAGGQLAAMVLTEDWKDKAS